MSYFNFIFIFIVIIFYYYFCLSYFSHSFIGIFIIIFCLGPFEASFFCRSVAHFWGQTVARTGPKQQLPHTGPIRAKPNSNYLPRASPPVFFLSRARRSFSSFLSTAWLSSPHAMQQFSLHGQPHLQFSISTAQCTGWVPPIPAPSSHQEPMRDSTPAPMSSLPFLPSSTHAFLLQSHPLDKLHSMPHSSADSDLSCSSLLMDKLLVSSLLTTPTAQWTQQHVFTSFAASRKARQQASGILAWPQTSCRLQLFICLPHVEWFFHSNLHVIM